MKLEVLNYEPANGWSDLFPPLDSPQTLVLVFGAPVYGKNSAPLEELAAAYPEACTIGCSTAGEIFGTSLLDDSLAVAILQLEHGSLAMASAPVPSLDASYRAGSTIAASLPHEGLRGLFVLSDGLVVNGSELVRGLNENLPRNVIVTGGLAGDHDRFEQTWTLDKGVVRQGHVVAVGLYGDRVQIGHGSKGGWDIFGIERRVTRSVGSVLYELDGRPALDLYKQYLGERASELPAAALLFPLALRANQEESLRVVRTILAVDESNRTMTFAGDVPEGSLAQLMKANFDRLVDGASDAAIQAGPGGTGSRPVLSIAISCVGRRLVLGERTEEELEATLDALPGGVSQIGFYSYGEISPLTSGSCDLHNQTMTLTTICEV